MLSILKTPKALVKRMRQKKELSKENRQAVLTRGLLWKAGLGGLAVYLLTRMSLFGYIKGLGFAAAAGIPAALGPVGWIGCFVGEMLNGFDGESLFYLIVLAGWIAARRILTQQGRFSLPKHFTGTFWQAAVIGVLLLGKTVTLYFVRDQSLMEFWFSVCQLVLQMAVFLCAMLLSGVLYTEKPFAEYSRPEGLAAVVLSVLLLASLGNIAFLGVSLAGVAAVMAVSVFASRYGCTGGAVSGIVAGLGLLLYDASMLEFAGIMILGAFLAGLFAGYGKLATAAAMLMAHGGIVLIYGKPMQLLTVTAATLTGILLFVLIPQEKLERVVLPPLTAAPADAQMRKRADKQSKGQLAIRMHFAADAMEMLGESIKELAGALQRKDAPDIGQVYEAVENEVCAHCRRKMDCCVNDYDRLKGNFKTLTAMMKARGKLSATELSGFWREECVRPENICRSFEKHYGKLAFVSGQCRQVNTARNLVLEQYMATSELLGDIGEELHQAVQTDAEMEELLTERLCKEGFSPEKVSCIRGKEDRLFIDLYYPNEKKPLPGELRALVEKCLSVSFSEPVEADAKSMTKISLFEPPPYRVSLAVSQLPGRSRAGNQADTKNSVNGDTVTSFYDARGNYYLLLSDGMGRGRRAALDSMTTCTILKKLITAGFGWQTSLRLLNTSLAVKSADESTATADMVKLDLYEGKAEFIKAGAASSFLANGKTVSRIRSFTLPIGIVSGVNFDSRKVDVSPGDLILLTSDGVPEEKEQLVARRILECKDEKAEKLAKAVCEEAAKGEEAEKDDITAAVLRIAKLEK